MDNYHTMYANLKISIANKWVFNYRKIRRISILFRNRNQKYRNSKFLFEIEIKSENRNRSHRNGNRKSKILTSKSKMPISEFTAVWLHVEQQIMFIQRLNEKL